MSKVDKFWNTDLEKLSGVKNIADREVYLDDRVQSAEHIDPKRIYRTPKESKFVTFFKSIIYS